MKKILIEFSVMTLAAFVGTSGAFFLFKWKATNETSQKLSQGQAKSTEPAKEK